MAFSVDRNIAGAKSIPALALVLQKLFIDLEDFLNENPAIQPDIGTGFQRTRLGDLLISQSLGNIMFSFIIGENAKVDVTIGPATNDLNTNYKGLTTTGTNPTAVELPSDGNFGFHYNTGSSKLFLAYNYAGTIKKVELT